MICVDLPEPTSPRILSEASRYWRDRRSSNGFFVATRDLLLAFWEFVRDSAPSRLRSRFGDADYDWDHHVNTTSGAVGWRDRLIGTFHSQYQPTEPASFREMLDAFQQHTNANLADVTFIDLGSGKGRVLLMASDYPFRRIVGVELLPSLNRIAQENLSKYKSQAQKSFVLESVCADATRFPMPEGPLLIYLFNPFPESGVRRAFANLKKSLESNPRPAYVLYHNPLLEQVLAENGSLKKIAGTHQYSIFAFIHEEP